MIAFVLLKYLNPSINTLVRGTKADRFFYRKDTRMEEMLVSDKKQIIANSFLCPKLQDIINKYSQEGKPFINTLNGEFSLGIWDNDTQTFFGARDRMGIKPFYYYNDNEKFIFSSSIKFIKEQIQDSSLDNQWISDTLTGVYYDQQNTQIHNIKRLPPGHFIEVSSTSFKTTPYWELSKNEPLDLSDQDYIHLFQEKLQYSVSRRISGNIGAELSGGLDSSGIASMAASALQNSKNSLFTFSHIIPPENLGKVYPFDDEQNFIDLVLNKYKIKNSFKVSASDKGILSEMQKELRIHGVPICNTLSYFSDVIYDSAKENRIDTLLSGFGGDQLISAHASFRIIELAKKLDLKTLKTELGVNYTSKKFIATILSNQFSSLYQWYKISRNNHNYDRKLNSTFINPEFAQEHSVKRRFWETYRTSHIKTLDELLLFLINDPFIQERTETTGESARHRGVEYSFPYLDADLLEFYHNAPSHLKYNLGRKRYIYREALKNILPQEIYKRTDKKISTVPAIFHRFNKDYKIILDFLQSAKNKEGSEFIDIDAMISRMPIYKSIKPGEHYKILNIELFMSSLMLLLYLNKEY